MPEKTYCKRAMLLTLILLIIAIICILMILFPNSTDTNDAVVADIYQEGNLLQSISLTDLTESYTFTVTGENGAVNEIEVRPGSVGIISADCPDKLCVHQGFITNSQIPITCLPNRVVIRVRTVGTDEITPDIITY